MAGAIRKGTVKYEAKNPGKKAKIQLVPNPGWMPRWSKEIRGQEAPAIMMESPHTRQDGQSTGNQSVNPKLGDKQKAEPDAPSVPTGSTSKTDTQGPEKLPLASAPRREGLRDREPREPSLQRLPKSTKSGPKAINDPNGYLRIPPAIPQYIPGHDGHLSVTPEIGPLPDKLTLTRVPPRPQNRESGIQRFRPDTPPSLPALKPIAGGRTGKEGTSYEAPEGKSPARAPIDTSTWKPYGSAGQSLSPKGKGKEPISNLQSLPVRPKLKGKENQKPANVDSQISGRLRSKANPIAVVAAQKAMEASSKKKGKDSKEKRDLLMYLLRRGLDRRMQLI